MWSCYSLFFLTIDLYFLISAVTAQLFIPTAELAIPIGISIYEANEEIEIQLLTAEMKIRKYSEQFIKPSTLFKAFYVLTHYLVFLLKKKFFFIDFF